MLADTGGVVLDRKLLLRIEEAAEQLAFGRNTLYRLLQTHQIPTVHIGKAVRIPRVALEHVNGTGVVPTDGRGGLPSGGIHQSPTQSPHPGVQVSGESSLSVVDWRRWAACGVQVPCACLFQSP